MDRPLTELETGIKVKIASDEFEKLKKKKGFLDYQSYPDEYKEISIFGEVGRFLFFRFIAE